jgi:hypothetical protein
MIGRRVVLLALVAATLSPALPLAAQTPCEGPGADPWVVDFRDRVLAYSSLAAFAAATHGPPVSCQGAITMEFDGANYGSLELAYAGGVTLTVETQPIETSIVTLRSEPGFADPAAVRAALRAYTEGIGVAIDWDSPDITTEGPESVETFWDPEAGLNASASLLNSDGRLVAVRFSMAL